MSYQNILVPIDDSPISYAAVEHAEKIAQAFGSHITILSVLAVDPMIGVDFYKVAPSITEYILAAERNAKGRLEDLQQTLLGHGIHVTTRIARDVSTATAILNIADEINGYVATSPLVNTFLLAAFFKSIEFSINGNAVKYACSCLKYALFVCIPLLCIIPSILFNKYSNSFISFEKVVT